MISRESERDGLREKEREKENLTWARFTEKFESGPTRESLDLG